MKKMSVKRTSSIIMVLVFWSFSCANGQEIPDTAGKGRLELTGVIGEGIEEHNRGITTTGKTIKLSGGGGTGVEITLGYGLSKRLGGELSLGYQKSTFLPKVTNADGKFTRNFILGTLKSNIPLPRFKNTQLKIGAGVGYYTSGKWDENFTQLPGGSHTVIDYDRAMGIHLSGEVEYFLSNTESMICGIKYYNVKYDAKSVTDNNLPIPLSWLKDEFKKIDGSGIDLFLGAALYF